MFNLHSHEFLAQRHLELLQLFEPLLSHPIRSLFFFSLERLELLRKHLYHFSGKSLVNTFNLPNHTFSQRCIHR